MKRFYCVILAMLAVVLEITYAKPTSENDVANSHQFYIRVY